MDFFRIFRFVHGQDNTYNLYIVHIMKSISSWSIRVHLINNLQKVRENMQSQSFVRSSLVFIIVIANLFLSACGPTTAPTIAATTTPEWFDIKMIDVKTGKAFTINDFAGKVVLIESIAEWCPNCLFQQGETRNMRQQLGNPEDLIVISLDVD